MLTVVAYAGIVTGRLKPDTSSYGYLNLLSAVCCGYAAADARVWSITALNVAWGLIATCGLVTKRGLGHHHYLRAGKAMRTE